MSIDGSVTELQKTLPRKRFRKSIKAATDATPSLGAGVITRKLTRVSGASFGAVTVADQAGWPAEAWTAVITTSATSLGWEIMTTCEAPSISVTVAPMRS